MTFSQSTYHSATYRAFKEIDAGDYRTIARFFEEHERTIGRLEFPEYFELRVCYAAALFEIGAYERHLQQVDFILESSIEHNIQFFQGEDLFCKTLFQKAASNFNLMQYDKAEYLLRELIKINPYYPDVDAFLRKTIYQQNPKLIRTTRATATGLFLLAAIIVCLEQIFIESLYPDYFVIAQRMHIGIFLLGVLILIGGDIFLRLKIRRDVRRLVERARERRRLRA